MVLAASPKQAMVWGFCEAGASVSVSLDGGAKVQATIGPDQATGTLTTWRVKLPATKASFTNHTVTATSGGKTATLTNFLFGEVWVCSGKALFRSAFPARILPTSVSALLTRLRDFSTIS